MQASHTAAGRQSRIVTTSQSLRSASKDSTDDVYLVPCHSKAILVSNMLCKMNSVSLEDAGALSLSFLENTQEALTETRQHTRCEGEAEKTLRWHLGGWVRVHHVVYLLHDTGKFTHDLQVCILISKCGQLSQ